MALKNGATLDAITWLGTLKPAAGATVNVIGGLTVQGVLPDTQGTIDLTAGSATLAFGDSDPLSVAQIVSGGTAGLSTILFNGAAAGTVARWGACSAAR